MELWIRSQDKTRLEHTYSLCIFEIDKLGETRYIIENSDSCIAVYKTKERALQILDEIHQKIIEIQTIEIAPDSYKIIKRKRNVNCVYEMPSE